MADGLQRARDAARASRATDEQFRILAYPCPYPPCSARPGKWCRDYLGGTAKRLHTKRVKAADEARENPAAKEGQTNGT